MRRFYVFAEDPCKSTITTSEPCSPVFKEAQPRPSEQSISLISRIGIFMNFIIVHNVFLLLVIIVIKAIQPDCDKIKGSSVLLLETPLTRSKYISPYTHAQHLTRTSRTFYTFAVTKPPEIPLQKVDAIRRVQLRTAGSRPIDEVVFAQNVPTYNPEWQHSNEGKAMSYLATLVCRYMNE